MSSKQIRDLKHTLKLERSFRHRAKEDGGWGRVEAVGEEARAASVEWKQTEVRSEKWPSSGETLSGSSPRQLEAVIQDGLVGKTHSWSPTRDEKQETQKLFGNWKLLDEKNIPKQSSLNFLGLENDASGGQTFLIWQRVLMYIPHWGHLEPAVIGRREVAGLTTVPPCPVSTVSGC